MRVEARYRFIGEDGSLGYRNGRIYRLVIARPGQQWPVEIVEGGAPCPYSSENTFRANWEEVGQFEPADKASRD